MKVLKWYSKFQIKFVYGLSKAESNKFTQLILCYCYSNLTPSTTNLSCKKLHLCISTHPSDLRKRKYDRWTMNFRSSSIVKEYKILVDENHLNNERWMRVYRIHLRLENTVINKIWTRCAHFLPFFRFEWCLSVNTCSLSHWPWFAVHQTNWVRNWNVHRIRKCIDLSIYRFNQCITRCDTCAETPSARTNVVVFAFENSSRSRNQLWLYKYLMMFCVPFIQMACYLEKSHKKKCAS